MPEQQEQRIEGRRYLLEVEKRLSGEHKGLAYTLGHLSPDASQDARDAYQAALWSIGAAIVQVARLQNLQ